MIPVDAAQIATGRKESLFASDYEALHGQIAKALSNARVLVIGGAGSIGTATTKLLASYDLAALHVVDRDENSLVELVRDLRGSAVPPKCRDPRFVPIDFCSAVMRRLIDDEDVYDFVLNFAAVKHVRSEKDVYSILQMLHTNVLAQAKLLRWLRRRGSRSRYFSVSTDKAANPVNIMGASKRLMEHVMFSGLYSHGMSTTSARFANVAFSNGSLLQGWQHRVSKAQPVSVPVGARRYFVSLDEAGQICLMAAVAFNDRTIAVPRVSDVMDLQLLEDIAKDFLRANGYEASPCTDASIAIAGLRDEQKRGRYPLLLTPLDTVGEKSYEEFVGAGEEASEVGLSNLQAISYSGNMDSRISAVVSSIQRYANRPTLPVDKDTLVKLVGSVIPEFAHADGAASLDGRL